MMDEIDRVLNGNGKNKRTMLHEIIVRLANMAAYAERDSDAINAAEKLLTRRYGAPTQHVRTEGTIGHVDLTQAFIEAVRSYIPGQVVTPPMITVDDNGNNVARIDENMATHENVTDATPIAEE